MDCDNILDRKNLKIKEKLNRDQIKLWLPPFLGENQRKNEEELKKLADSFSKELSIPTEVCLQCLNQFQTKAINNLRERNNFRETGQASLKVRVPNEQGGRTLTVCISLSQTGLALKQEISQAISVPIQRLKVIFKGQFLKDQENLENQGVKHGLHMMAIVLAENSDLIIPKYEKYVEDLDSTKADIKLLSESRYFQVADQSGKLLKLPEDERKSLISAMTLHEKGRVALKREDYAFALVLLLEAEKEFRQCNSSLLKSVDNYGVLSLDIVWCYLNLESVTQLPDAEDRLNECERSFVQSYGPDLERLTALKGFTGNESALFVRLHLLQSIVLYHQNKIDQSKILIRKVEEELKKLQVDDGQLCQLIELGYGTAEARLALRASGGDVNSAVIIMENKRIEKKRNEEMEIREKKLRKKRKKLGKCLNGDWIEPELHNSLVSMGFGFEISKWALAQCNNNINEGINLINDVTDEKSSDNSLRQMINLGFEANEAEMALTKHEGDSRKAIDELLTKRIEEDSDSSDSDQNPSTSELKRKRSEAYARLSEGFSMNEDDHLDLNLVTEAAFLRKYKELMND